MGRCPRAWGRRLPIHVRVSSIAVAWERVLAGVTAAYVFQPDSSAKSSSA